MHCDCPGERSFNDVVEADETYDGVVPEENDRNIETTKESGLVKNIKNDSKTSAQSPNSPDTNPKGGNRLLRIFLACAERINMCGSSHPWVARATHGWL